VRFEACLRFFIVSERLKNPNMGTAHVMGEILAPSALIKFYAIINALLESLIFKKYGKRKQ
jgi:hypothetical protein